MRGNSLCTVSPYSDKCRRSANHSSKPASIRYIYRRRGAGRGCGGGKGEGVLSDGQRKTQYKPKLCPSSLRLTNWWHYRQHMHASSSTDSTHATDVVVAERTRQVGRLSHAYPGVLSFFYGEEHKDMPGIVCTA